MCQCSFDSHARSNVSGKEQVDIMLRGAPRTRALCADNSRTMYIYRLIFISDWRLRHALPKK